MAWTPALHLLLPRFRQLSGGVLGVLLRWVGLESLPSLRLLSGPWPALMERCVPGFCLLQTFEIGVGCCCALFSGGREGGKGWFLGLSQGELILGRLGGEADGDGHLFWDCVFLVGVGPTFGLPTNCAHCFCFWCKVCRWDTSETTHAERSAFSPDSVNPQADEKRIEHTAQRGADIAGAETGITRGPCGRKCRAVISATKNS